MENGELDALQIRISYLEDYIKQINEVVLENGRLITRMDIEQTKLKQQLDEVSDQLPGPESRKPPHY